MSEKRDLANVLNAFKTMIHIEDRMDLAYHILPEAIQRAIDAETKWDEINRENENLWVRSIDTESKNANLLAQVAALREAYGDAIGIIEKTILDGSIDYMELQKQIDAYVAYKINPDPGEKIMRVVDAAREATIHKGSNPIAVQEHHIYAIAALEQALAELENPS